MKRKYTTSNFLMGLFLLIISHWYVLAVSAVLLVLGRRLEIKLLYIIGWGIFILYIIICTVIQLGIRKASLSDSDNEDFNSIMDACYGVLEDADFEKFLTMTPLQLSELTDTHLMSAIAHRINVQIKQGPTFKEGFDGLLEYQKIFYACYSYSFKMRNGGLLGLFSDSCRAVVPYVGSALGEIGAHDHRACFERFLKQNSLEPYALSEFDTSDKAALKALYKKYRFAEFDSAYFELEEEDDLLVSFVRDNIHIF